MLYLTPTGIIEANEPNELIQALKSPWNNSLSNLEYIKLAASRVWLLNGKYIGATSVEEFVSDMVDKGLIKVLPKSLGVPETN